MLSANTGESSMTSPMPRLVGTIVVASFVVFGSSAVASAPVDRYSVSDETVTDTKTKLVWQRRVPSSKYIWADAKAYCAGVGPNLGGSGWRLPTMKELQTIVDDSRTNPAIDPGAFPETPPDAFWSSSPVVGSPGYAWNVFFYNGSTYDIYVDNAFNVRCVTSAGH